MDTELLKRTFVRLEVLKGNLSEPAIAERLAHHNTIINAAGPEHTYSRDETTSDGTFICGCGWKSEIYIDGSEYAYADWREHIEEILE